MYAPRLKSYFGSKVLICTIGITAVTRSASLCFLLVFVRQTLVPDGHLFYTIHSKAWGTREPNVDCGIKSKRTWSSSDKSFWGSKSAHKLILNISTVVEGGVSRVWLTTRTPRDFRSNLMFSNDTLQSDSKVESDFAWITFRTMTKIRARCRCNRRIMSGESKTGIGLALMACSSIYMCLSKVFLESRPQLRSNWLCRTHFQMNCSQGCFYMSCCNRGSGTGQLFSTISWSWMGSNRS